MRSMVLALAILWLAPAALAQSPAPPGCDGPDYRALDFWIGEWDAYRADTNQLAGRSSIRAEDNGCVITEHWLSVGRPYSGRSLSNFDARTRRWEQYWVDSTGARTLLIGGPIENGRMRMTTAEPITTPGIEGAYYARVTWSAETDGAVLQHGEASADGQSWTTRYAFIYRRRPQ